MKKALFSLLSLSLAILLLLCGCSVRQVTWSSVTSTISSSLSSAYSTFSSALSSAYSTFSSSLSSAYSAVLSWFVGGEPDEPENDVYIIYRTVDSISLLEKRADLLQVEEYPVGDDVTDEVEAVLSLFVSPSESDNLSCAIPTGVTLDDWSLENTVVTLTFSPSFLNLTEMEQTITAFCAALTLCALEEVEAVTVTADGQVFFSRLMAEDALLTDTDTDPYARQLRLYFADQDGRYLISEYHSLTLDEDTSPARYVMEELLRGPNSDELQSAIPAGTTLLSCSADDGVCTVDLSDEFYKNRPETAVGERLAIYSIVDSLTALSDVDSVILLVEGESLDTYVYRSLAEPLVWYDAAIGPVSAPKGETDGVLYLALPGLKEIAPLPCRISDTGYESHAEAVLAVLLSFDEPGYPILFSTSSSITDITITDSICIIDLSEGFFVSLPAEGRNAAIQSLAATLCALDGIDSVYFTIGGNEAVYEGTDWSGPWGDFSQITAP